MIKTVGRIIYRTSYMDYHSKEHNTITRSVIAPVTLAGILILAVLIGTPSNALMSHSSSEYEKCVKSSNNCFLLNDESSNVGNGATSKESNNGNVGTSQENTNTGNTQESNNGNVGSGCKDHPRDPQPRT